MWRRREFVDEEVERRARERRGQMQRGTGFVKERGKEPGERGGLKEKDRKR